jgi:hypothetical protein
MRFVKERIRILEKHRMIDQFSKNEFLEIPNSLKNCNRSRKFKR